MVDTVFRVAPGTVSRFVEPSDDDKKGLILQYTDPTKSVKHLLWYATTFKTLVVQSVVK